RRCGVRLRGVTPAGAAAWQSVWRSVHSSAVMKFLDLVAETDPARPFLARLEFDIRTGAQRLDALIDFIGLTALFANRRDDQFTHALGLALRLASPAEPTDLRIVAGAVAVAHKPADAA